MATYTLTEGDDDFPGSGQANGADDSILGLGGSDYIDAGNGANTVYGGDDNDAIYGNNDLASADDDQVFYGGSGNDLLQSGNGDDSLDGGDGDDRILSGSGTDMLFGGAGNDRLEVGDWRVDPPTGQGSSATMYILAAGGDGNDSISSTFGAVNFYGGLGNDTLTAVLTTGTAGLSSIFDGGEGKDFVSVDLNPDDAQTGPVNLLITANDGDVDMSVNGENIVGVLSAEIFRLRATVDTAQISGIQGSDQITLIGAEAATISGGAGDDVIELLVGSGTFEISGDGGEDLLRITALQTDGEALFLDMGTGVLTFGDAAAGTATGFETAYITGSALGDTLQLGDGHDVVQEAKNRDSGDDDFSGGGGDDWLYGGKGLDILNGEAGEDFLFGGNGADVIRGGAGADTMAGGAAEDVFVFAKTADSGTVSGSIDNINYFTVSSAQGVYLDRIDLSEIDAIASTPGDDAFTFIGTRAFTAEGQVRVQQSGASTYVVLNTAGTSGGEMKICLTNFDATSLQSVDFIL